MKFDWNVHQLNTHRLMSRIFDLASNFQDGGYDVTSFHAKKCCHPASEHDASGQHHTVSDL